MNNIYENNMRFLPLFKFIDKYKKLLIIMITLIVLSAISLFIFFQIKNTNNIKAAEFYSQWEAESSKSEPNMKILDEIFTNIETKYSGTGYYKTVLLNKANLELNQEKLGNALESFNKLIKITNGFNGNKIYNKISRISAARILLTNERYDDALKMISSYSSSDTNAFIHELTGDILLKQNKIQLAIDQYQIASQKYSDESSRSIVEIKIANIGE